MERWVANVVKAEMVSGKPTSGKDWGVGERAESYESASGRWGVGEDLLKSDNKGTDLEQSLSRSDGEHERSSGRAVHVVPLALDDGRPGWPVDGSLRRETVDGGVEELEDGIGLVQTGEDGDEEGDGDRGRVDRLWQECRQLGRKGGGHGRRG